MKTLIYDIEVYPNVFLCVFSSGTVFEISWRKNEVKELIKFMLQLDEMVGFNNMMYDYPVLHYIIEHQNDIEFMNTGIFSVDDFIITPKDIFKKSDQIINTPYEKRFNSIIWPNRQIVKQIDLMLVHHFDNASKLTSLKALEFAMKSKSIETLPYIPGSYLTVSEIEKLIKYCKHDVSKTEDFWKKSQEQIEFRRQIYKDTGMDALNFNDTKIGKKYFEIELEKLNPGCCYSKNRKKRQTPRLLPYNLLNLAPCPKEFQLPEKPKEMNLLDIMSSIKDEYLRNIIFADDLKPIWEQGGKPLSMIQKIFPRIKESKRKKFIKIMDDAGKKYKKSFKGWEKACSKKLEENQKAVWIPAKNILFDYINFQSPEFNEVLNWYKNLNITHTKSGIATKCTYKGFDFHFGAGGIHGSIKPFIVESDEHYIIRDIDVTSYYPSIAIQNKLYPAHLGKEFCRIYENLSEQRKKHKKGTTVNEMLKLALNGVYGDSNNKYSVFYDPQYTMAVTINGQLLLCMLAEQLMRYEWLKLIQINTDGLTIKYPKEMAFLIENIELRWMDLTKLQLETSNYRAMFIRDVNNYIAVYEDQEKEPKRKGDYEYDREWHQDHSGMVIQKAVELYFLNGTDVEDFIRNHTDKFDFMMKGKVNRGSRLVLSVEGQETELQNVIRFYFNKEGGELFKYMPPLKATPSKIRRNALQGTKGWKVKICNDIDDYEGNIDCDYYIKEAYKLIKPLER